MLCNFFAFGKLYRTTYCLDPDQELEPEPKLFQSRNRIRTHDYGFTTLIWKPIIFLFLVIFKFAAKHQ
jgi:hypothetical protein